MPRRLSAAVLMLVCAALPAAEEAEQLDAEFLEYLANLEGDSDDWTLIVAADEAQAAPRKDAESEAPNTSKQADRPAVDER